MAYLLAVTQRTTMGAVALDASVRFGTTAEQLSTLAVLQLLFYAVMQIPVGLLLDRFGSRRLLAAGAILMALGQIVVALSVDLPGAVLGRVLVGIGDACTFISMIRMSNSWFSGKQASNLQQWFATIGQTGQILSAVPFAFLLHETSWEQAFLTAAAITALVGALVWLFSRENPAIVRDRSVQLKDVVARLKRNSRKPITWLAFFTHFTTQSTGTSFALLWGVPFMVSALSLPLATAGSMLTLFVITNMSMGPVIGWFCGRWPQFRHVLIFSIIGSIILVWGLVLLNPNPTPFWMLIVLVMTIGVGGPASMVAFDYSKEAFVPSELGATNGLINVGGFLAALVMMWIVGVALDALPGPVLYSFEHFRIAFALQLVVTLFGLLGLVWSLRAQRNKRPRVLV